ncbi:MAG: bifunctional phosphoglucose/phosphomannose isomerase [Actinomycetota bacterium]
MSPGPTGAAPPTDRLDDPASYPAVDPTDFLAAVDGLPAQLEEAIRRASGAPGLPSADGIHSIAVLGMGGSGISGELCRTLLAPVAPVPVLSVRDYALPAWVGPDTLVFAVSYSGNTEETLAAYVEATRRGARVVAVTSGGTLAAQAADAGHAVVEVPGGMMPRAALGYVSLPPLVVCSRLGLAPGLEEALPGMLATVGQRIAECSRDVPSAANVAKQLAVRLAGSLPVVWGTEGIAGSAAYRWKCQLNENAKAYAGWAVFPELNHNEVVGLYHPEAGSAPYGIVVLRHEAEHPRTARRILATSALVGGSVGFVEEVWARGDTPLARLFDLIATGDLVSTYLGIATGIDPAPIEAISLLKAALGD